MPTVFGQEGDLFYKFLDESMFSVTTVSKNDRSTLTVYLINGVTGRVVHQFKEADVSPAAQHKVCALFSEQFFALTFMRRNPTTGISQQELTVIELYKKQKEGDTQKLITDYFKGAQRITGDTYSAFAEEGDPVVLRESYFLPFGVKALALTETANHITGRTMLFITADNKLFQLPQSGFTARRLHPHQVKAAPGWFSLPDVDELDLEPEEPPMELQLKSDRFPVYDPVIPQYDVRFLSYDLPLVGLSGMRTFPTKLESTSQVLAYGHDLFLSRIRPDNKYDMVDEDFNYSLLFLAIAGILAVDYGLIRYLKGERGKKEFLIH